MAAGIADEYENRAATVEPRNGTTVVTTSPRTTGDASIVACFEGLVQAPGRVLLLGAAIALVIATFATAIAG